MYTGIVPKRQPLIFPNIDKNKIKKTKKSNPNPDLSVKLDVKLDVKLVIILFLFAQFIRTFYSFVYMQVLKFGQSLLGGPLLPTRLAGDDGNKKVAKNEIKKTKKSNTNPDLAVKLDVRLDIEPDVKLDVKLVKILFFSHILFALFTRSYIYI